MVGMATTTSRWVGVEVMVVVVLLLPGCVTGRTVSVTSIKIAPYLMEVKDSVTGDVAYDGYIKELLDKVGQLTGVSFQIQSLASQFGEVDSSTGQWSGLVGEVVSAEAEMAAAPMTLTSLRAKVMDFSVPFQHFGGVIVLKRVPVPSVPFGQRVRFMFLPLQDSVWLMAAVAYLLTGVILYVICYVNPYEWRHLCANHQATRREAESFTCLNTFWFLMSTWMWQGFIRAPRSLGGRLVVTVWWMFVVVFLLTYTASLTNLLRVGPLEEKDVNIRILSLKDLVFESHRDMDVGFVRGGSTDAFLQHSQTPYLFELWKTVRERGSSVPSVEEGIRRVRESYVNSTPFAFLTESILAQHMVRQEPCDLYMVGDVSILGSYSLAYRVGWDLSDAVDLALLSLQENGNLKALEEKWFGGPCQAHVLDTRLHEADQELPFYPVNMGSFSGIMIILAAGCFVGALVTLLEVVVFRVAEKPSGTYGAGLSPAEWGKGGNTASSKEGAQNVSAV